MMNEYFTHRKKAAAALMMLAGLMTAEPQMMVAAVTEVSSLSASPAKQRITGIVKDAFGEPITGASIIEKGTQNGITSDLDGSFVLNVNEGAQIVVSFIGYTSQTLRASSNMTIVLEEDRQVLDDVVVVGYVR